MENNIAISSKNSDINFKVDEKYFDEIQVINNFLPDELYEKLLKKYSNPPLQYGWKSHQDDDPHGHWNVDIAKAGRFNLAHIYSRLGDIEREVWDHISSNYDILKDQKLIRCYINGHTFGVDGYYHRDSTRQDETTTVMYLTDEWDINWGGETVFVSDNEDQPDAVRASIPARNRAVIFNANIKHCGRGVSRKYLGLRIVFVMKGRKKRTDNFEKLSSFLYDNGAANKRHTKGSLHDHLVSVYQILEEKGCDEDVCFGGGLHSVFGTNIFKNNIFTDEHAPKLIEEFGVRAATLAKLFSILKRPNTLENTLGVVGDHVRVDLNNGTEGIVDIKTYNDLRMIECANLIQQKVFPIEKYPNLRKLWSDVNKEQDHENNK